MDFFSGVRKYVAVSYTHLQTALVRFFARSSRNIADYLPAIRIAIRNGYAIGKQMCIRDRTYGFDMTFHKARHNFGTHITLSLGVPIETVSRMTVSYTHLHCGRHTYATEITLSHGVPLETVSKMLGHSRISTTQIYGNLFL